MEHNIDQEPAPQIPVQNLAAILAQISGQTMLLRPLRKMGEISLLIGQISPFTKGKNASRTSVVAHSSRDNYKGKGPEGSEDRYVYDMRNTTITKQQIDQLRKFTTDLLKEFDCTLCKPTMSLLESVVKLKANEGALLKESTFYIKLVRKLNFMTNTRLDITFSVQHLSQFLQSPREPYLKAAYHVLRYLMNEPCLGIFLSNSTDCTITIYCDSDWVVCPDSRRSVSGYIVLMGDSPICWKSKKQAMISLSSVEAEHRAVRKVVGELVLY
uniref:Reverse transcriptase Ty1/copia-type domain-containing protein n=1 Tax=Solanum lycopersicum TaxID=4081 RepID=A0A3Q7HY27_SOLLC